MPRGKKKSASGNRTTSKRAVNCGTRAQREQPTDGTPQVPTRKRSRQTQNQEVSENTGAAESQLLLRREGSGQEPMPAPRDSDNSEPLTRSDIISLIQETVKSLERSNSGATTRVSEPRWNSSDNPSSTSTDNAPRHPTTAVSGQRTACTGVAGSSIETTTQPVLGSLPPVDLLQHVSQLGESVLPSTRTVGGPIRDCQVMIGAGLPPIPAKLVSKIEAGEFVDMAELLPDRFGIAKSRPGDESARPSKHKQRTVTTILEWIQCFSIYLAVIAKKQPQRIPDLLAYQTLIIESQLEYQGDAWMGYDRRFRQRAAANPHTSWSTIDTTLWNLAFAGKARAARCNHCFSLSHASNQCEWAPDIIPNDSNYRQPPIRKKSL